jgi:hypothetical protein
MKYFVLLIVLAIVLFYSCKPASQSLNTEKPEPLYKKVDFTPKNSVVNIPIEISISGLQKTINSQLTGLLYEDKSYTDNDEDNMQIKVWKKNDIVIDAYPDAFSYQVPLKLWIKIRYGALGFYDYKEVEGAIQMNFKTTYDINSNWEMVTKTVMTDYKWLETPKISIAGTKISISTIANSLLNSNKKFLENTIDEQIKSNLDIQSSAKDAWLMMQDPIHVHEAYKVWLKLTPKSIAMTPLKVENGKIYSAIGIQSSSEVILGEKPVVTKNPVLPPFNRPSSIPEIFIINLSAEVPYLEAEKIAKSQIVGQTFTEGKRSITVLDLNIYGQEEDVIIGATVDGSMKGQIYFRGKPVYDAATSTVEITNVDFDVQTKNVLLKSADWLFKSTIIKKMTPYLKFPLEQNLTEAKVMIQKELTAYKVMEGITMNGFLEDLAIDGIYPTPTGMRVLVSTKGKIKMKVDNLKF